MVSDNDITSEFNACMCREDCRQLLELAQTVAEGTTSRLVLQGVAKSLLVNIKLRQNDNGHMWKRCNQGCGAIMHVDRSTCHHCGVLQ